jgi:hypothetical protein
LAYVRGDGPTDVPEELVLRDLATGTEQVIDGYGNPETGVEVQMTVARFEWSPDGTRLLFEVQSDWRMVGVLDPATTDHLAEALHFDGYERAGTWLDDDRVAATFSDFAGDVSAESRYVQVDAGTGRVLPTGFGFDERPVDPDQPAIAMAADPGGRLAVLAMDDPEQQFYGTLHLPGGTTIADVRSFDW